MFQGEMYMAVIKDVARLAGLSVGVVSKYLNYPDRVRPDTKERIEAAIKELNYSPSMTARSMRTKKSGMIAIVVPDIQDEFYAQLFGYLKADAFEHGYTSILYTTENDSADIRSYLGRMSIANFDGIIPCFINESELFDEYVRKRSSFPIVMMTGLFPENSFSTVAIDLYQGGYLATKHLIDRGYRRIAFIGGTKDGKITASKFEGYRKALQEAGMEVREEYQKYGKSRYKEGYLAAESFLTMPERPDAVVASNDSVAAGFIKYAIGQGCSVPADIGVMGFDNIPLASIFEPGISTISVPLKEMCRKAMDMLIEQIEGRQTEIRSEVFDIDVIARGSSER